MQTRRDQVQAHVFTMTRLASGMLRSEPDAPFTPTGRTSRGAVSGLIIAAVLGVVIGLIGVFFPGGSTTWRKPGTLVIVKQTGERLLYVGDELHPVLNETSAKLLAGNQFSVQQVDSGSLAGVTTGAPVGLLGAPDAVPVPAQLSSAPWLACGTQDSGAGPQLSLAIGLTAAGGSLQADQGLLVADPTGAEYLLWRGQRLWLDVPHGADAALGYRTTTPYPVTSAFLDTLPAGPDLSAPTVDAIGTAGPTLAGRPTRIGQLFASPDGSHYLLRADGLVPLTDTLFRLLAGDPRVQQAAYGGGAVAAGPMGADDLAQHGVAKAGAPVTGLPASPPTLQPVPTGSAACVQVSGTGVAVVIRPAATVTGQPPVSEPGVLPSCRPADLIEAGPGAAQLVAALSSAGVPGATYLVTSPGVKYPVPAAALTQFGYSASAAVRLPAGLLALLPSGPSLDPAKVSGGGVLDETRGAAQCAG